MLQRGVNITELTVRGEEHQGAAADPPSDGRDDLFNLPVERLVLGRGKVRRQADQRLVQEVER